ncbi:tail assembly chaperone [Gordonia phage Pupper]|uniref:Tail assembly chaperone n=1 Tax=Gordonia phage Pupper TaxID=2571249 RepID=A0A4Y6EIQ8_9CAUD|nr:tail assembly chaperone [Gordonia phage Pupper]QDF18603.1 tail assembly chaperone [Gordonia phage Pupper]
MSDPVVPDPTVDPDLAPPQPQQTRRVVGEPVATESEAEAAPEEEKVTTLTEEERRDLQMLMTCGRRLKTIDVLGHKVKIQTLKSGDEMRIGLYTKPHLGSQGFSRAYQVGVCAAGIIDVDGTPLYSALSQSEDEDAEHVFAKRVELLEDYYAVALSKIYDEIMTLEVEFAKLADKLGKLSG